MCLDSNKIKSENQIDSSGIKNGFTSNQKYCCTPNKNIANIESD